MDILLINPFSWTRDGRAAYLPYGILYLASYLRKRGISVDMFDCNTRQTEEVFEVIEGKRPKYIGLSVLTGPVIKEALNISRKVKKQNPDIKIIWGGLHPTLFPEICRKEPSIDYVVRGEGEEALYRILQGKEYESIYENGELIDLNNEDMPAWELIPDMSKYIMNKFYGDRVLTINSSRGCVNRCAFCFNQGLKTHKWRGLSAENLYKQVVYLKRHYNINGVQFYEDSFDVDKKRVWEFCTLMFNGMYKINWAHFSNIKFANRNLLKMEKKAGCKEIGYGVESGSNRILKLLNKHQKTHDTKYTFQLLHEIGIKATALFMIGLPTETEYELNETTCLIKEIKSYQDICTIYRPYPGTPLYNKCKMLTPETLEEQADYYSYGKLATDIQNVSNVPTDKLNRLQRYFYRNMILKELFYSLNEFNFKRLWYLAGRVI